MQIDLSFQGYVRGAEIKKVYDIKKDEDVFVKDLIESGLTKEQIVDKITDGVYAVSFPECFQNCDETDVELFDYELTT